MFRFGPPAGAIDPTNVEPQLDYFFAAQEAERRQHIAELTEQARSNGNALFNSENTEGVIMHTPALLDDEDLTGFFANVINYRLVTRRRPTIILGGNVSEELVDYERLTRNIKAIREFGKTCIALSMPFGHYLTTYSQGTAIGEIRADLKGVGLQYHWEQAKRHRQPPQDIILASGDADIRAAAGDYLPEMQRVRAAVSDKVWLGGPMTMHDRLGPAFPRLNRCLDWYDTTNRFSPGIAPTNYGVSAGGYAGVRGFRDNWAFGETAQLSEDLIAAYCEQGVSRQMLRRVVLNSCRQLVRNMVEHEEIEYRHLAVSSGRRPSHRQYTPREDISVEVFQELLTHQAFTFLSRIFDAQVLWAVMEGQDQDDATRSAQAFAISKARAQIQRIGDHEGTGQIFDDACNSLSSYFTDNST